MRKTLIALAVLSACSDPHTGTTRQGVYVGTTQVETLAAGQTDNWTPSYCGDTYSICEIQGNASGSSLSGFGADVFHSNNLFWLRNVGDYPITLLHNTGSSTGYRFFLHDDRDQIIAPGRTYTLFTRWNWDADPTYQRGYYSMEDTAVHDVTSTSTPSRSLGTAFQPSTTRLTAVYYTVQVVSSLTLGGGDNGRIELRCDSSNPPTTVRGRVKSGATGVGVAGLTDTVTVEGQLHYLVPPADRCVIASVTETGSPSYSIVTQTEQTL